MPKNHTTAKEARKILKVYKETGKLKLTARTCKTSFDTVKKIILKNGYEVNILLKPKIIDSIIKDLSSGQFSITEVAKKHKTSRGNIDLVIIKYKVKNIKQPKNKKKNLNKRQINKIVKLHQKERLNMDEIGEIMGLSHGAVHTILLNNGVNLQETGLCYTIAKEKWPIIIKLYVKKKWSISKIKRKFNVSSGTIERILETKNIKIRDNGAYSSTPLTHQEEKKIATDYKNEKIDTRYIRKKYKISHERMLEIFGKYGVKMRNASDSIKIKLSKKENQKLLEEYGSGKSICLLAKEMKLSRPTITRILQENGITILNGVTRTISLKETRSRGISGWYKEFYFRSINELSFIINYLERKNIKALGESNFAIKYFDPVGKQRTYHPDFTTDKYIFEVKPKKFWTLDKVICKMNAAIPFALERGLLYRLVDYPVIIEPIIEKYYNNNFKFTKIGKKKFLRNYAKYLN